MLGTTATHKSESASFFLLQKGVVNYLTFPKPTHEPSKKFTVREALESLRKIMPVEFDKSVRLDDGTIVWNHNVETTGLKKDAERLVPHGLAKTVRRTNPIQHHSLNRCVTNRERARLQSFPDGFRFYGTPAEHSDQIGNAVPVRLAHAIAKSAMESHEYEMD